MSATIEFVNHASVRLANDSVAVLSDPWFFGDAFDHGWSLLYENEQDYIRDLLQRTTHIWLSHEHPDHFSPSFFKQYRSVILSNRIRLIYQARRDRRVAGYLEDQGFDVIEPDNARDLNLGNGFQARVVKTDFYDSALLVECDGVRIFNLNDCPLRHSGELRDFRDKHGGCDILLTQFSYAAWKGGRLNQSWRRMSAHGKLRAMESQINTLGASVCIPFASFVRFSNQLNSYMNDAVNTPDMVLADPVATKAKIIFMRPGEIQATTDLHQDSSSLAFWRDRYSAIPSLPLTSYGDPILPPEIEKLFCGYQYRIKDRNNLFLMRLARDWLPLRPFAETKIRLSDLGLVIQVSLLSGIGWGGDSADVVMNSHSLANVLRHDVGFDTLVVNGCFEEEEPGGFGRFAKCFAVGSLNANGAFVGFSMLANIGLVVNLIAKAKDFRC